MTNYQVIWDKNKIHFEQKVLEALRNGWEFFGPLIITACTTRDDKVVFSWNREMIKNDTTITREANG